ncbi:MAG: tyrosine-type recombinase/integrase [Ferruginibacter sp.]
MCLNLVRLFENEKDNRFLIYTGFKTNQQHYLAQRKYWKQFAWDFADFLYRRHSFDNHVANQFKILRCFVNYCYKEKGWLLNRFFPLNFIAKEAIPIHVITPEQLSFLINDMGFEKSLTARLLQTKDFFVFGCTVGLRIADLLSLTIKNLAEIDGNTYLVVQSAKTNTITKLLLPAYTRAILEKYKTKSRFLLPRFNKSNINIYIKKLAEKAGWTNVISKTRMQKGVPVLLFNHDKKKTLHRFCDQLTSHTMRRTAVTTLLSLGMPENLVRKVSGHAPGGKEFYRYVSLSQHLQDDETKRVFDILAVK